MNKMTEAFFDELEKISAINISGAQTTTPAKPGEVKAPITPKQLKAKAVNPKKIRGIATSYTRSNVEAPGTDVTIAAGQKSMMPPPIRV